MPGLHGQIEAIPFRYVQANTNNHGTLFPVKVPKVNAGLDDLNIVVGAFLWACESACRVEFHAGLSLNEPANLVQLGRKILGRDLGTGGEIQVAGESAERKV